MDALKSLASALAVRHHLTEKENLLRTHPLVGHKLDPKTQLITFFLQEDDPGCRVIFLSLVAIDQHTHVFFDPEKQLSFEIFHALLSELVPVEQFYASIGGIVGYHMTVLEKMSEQRSIADSSVYRQASGLDLSRSSPAIKKAVLAGIQALPETGMLFPLGGLGSRLNLKNAQGEPLPTAFLPFCGLSLLEILIRDTQAAEYLYYKLFSQQITMPCAMMTSKAQDIEVHIQAMCASKKWFHRDPDSFFLFSQISVPVVTQEGHWSMLEPLVLNLQPGGHGAIWRTAEERGVFQWFQDAGSTRLLIRQINNPIAGVDHGLFALMGVGTLQNKAFGFASCKRKVNAAEGILVLREEKGALALSNIEYTDFSQAGILDVPAADGFSLYPANTNLLFVNLCKILPAIDKEPLPGLMLNMKSSVSCFLKSGEKKEIMGGRLESMMQSISDTLTAPNEQSLATFLTYNRRQKTISTTKKQYLVDQGLLETPEGAFYDYLANSHELLSRYCHMQLPPMDDEEEYLKKGPGVIFVYHPSLGPLYEIIGQKIQRGIIAWGSELQLEITDVIMDSLDLAGSLLIDAKHVMGHCVDSILRYSNQTGKCVLKNVVIRNKGILRHAGIQYWKNNFSRHEKLHIHLEGMSEFHAENIMLYGSHTITVPHGQRWTAYLDNEGELDFHKEVIDEETWRWNMTIEKDVIKLQQESICHTIF